MTYLRLSRESKNAKNYGLQAQRRDLDIFLGQLCPDPSGCLEIASYTEIESGADDSRPELAKAMEHCRKIGATLLVSKLDRLSRRVSFIASLLEVKGLEFKVAAMPNADKFQLHIYSALAEQEREFISARTKAALKSAKERGVILGGNRGGQENANQAIKEKANNAAEKFRAIITPMVKDGHSLRKIASALAAAGIKTNGGSSSWTASAVSRIIARLGLKS